MDERVCRFGGSVDRFGGFAGSKLLVGFTLLAVSALLISALLAASDQSSFLSASSLLHSVGAVIGSHLVVVTSGPRVGSITSITTDVPIPSIPIVSAISTVNPAPAIRPADVHTMKPPLASLLCVLQGARVKRIVRREEQTQK